MSTQDHIALLRGAACVPKTGTREMINGAVKQWISSGHLNAGFDYQAMLAATPPAYAEALAAVLDGHEAMQKDAAELREVLQTLVDEYEPNIKTFATDAPRKTKWMAALAVLAKLGEKA